MDDGFLILIQDTPLLTKVCQCCHVIPGHKVEFTLGQDALEDLNRDNQHRHRPYDDTKQRTAGSSKLFPISGADGFRYDFRKQQHRQGEQHRSQRKGSIAVDQLDLRTDTCSAHGVRNGVQCQDGCEWPNGVVLLEGRPEFTGLVAVVFLHRDPRLGHGEDHRFKNGTEERDAQGDDDVEGEEADVSAPCGVDGGSSRRERFEDHDVESPCPRHT